ncbi:peptide chain release factor 1-like, mitochondrial [Octopus bimaculoides]|uniref:Prokaryotic-type class I peptide chain release factors domain-containing protein n=1 Tax=Octopus bimaculoides TaxID=37653 RepID=A0A0L8IB63_OCTBM|nr:peptide chain release factor 1-like, mitochondrial [Octopus bimaculoides]XP_014780552.1 peptide chain release factor 1-like, mitochondrial [Octopus bimaculoides]|eukprot:XP_014780545.1 PREDICTED: peptide chain release factor 1-like, mitochondrial [Octopus bimaculoides]
MIHQNVWKLCRPIYILHQIRCLNTHTLGRYWHHYFRLELNPRTQTLFNFKYWSSFLSPSSSSSPLSLLSSWTFVRHLAFQQGKNKIDRKVYIAYIKSLLQEFNDLQMQYLTPNEETGITHHESERYKQLMPVASKIEDMFTKEKEREELVELLLDASAEDKDLETIVKSETAHYNEIIQQLDDEIKSLLSFSSGSSASDVVVEVTPGVGGQESQLFAKEIIELYFNYAHYKGWDFSLVSEDRSDIGGIRKGTAMISGDDAYNYMKFEGGVHRVQRIPKTERGGRVHTSTVTVAVLPQPKDIDIALNPKDLQITTCRASGSGGQHVNTTDSAVRIVHVPTGMAAESQQERSQMKNKEIAMKLLQTKLYQKQLQQQEQEIQSNRKTQIGMAGRSEKIRTYNFNQDRITDHRLSYNIHNLSQFFTNGQILDNLLVNLLYQEREGCLHQKLEEFSLSMQKT